MLSIEVPQCRVFKVVLCGEYGVGKSSLFRRFVYDTFVDTSDRYSSVGFDNFEKRYTFNDKEVVLQLWDTGGLERIATVTSGYFKFAHGAILVFSFDDFSSFNVLPQHLLDIVTSAEKARIYLCGNKQDLANRSTRPTEEDIALFYEENQISGEQVFANTFKVSCKTNQGVHLLFESIARDLASHFIAPPDQTIFMLKPRTDNKSCCSKS
ncbi:unnamed protein product [Soboliphyme baturini]|uniref:Small monomeric GTPase n=1 Tax=Soboliphyme baturini TaxID=241478 RepID=A0A183IC37_9BILA|nr:unnamed protein product [Soboliphyme baturini]